MWRLFLLVTVISAQKLPSYIHTCSQSDPDFNKCFLKNGNDALPFLLKGDKKLKIPSLSPLKVDKVIVSPSSTFHLGLTNISIYGFEKTVLKKADAQLEKNKFTVHLDMPLLDLYAQYTTSGRILVLPIEGTGPCNIKIYGGIYIYTVDFDHYDKKGRDHIKIRSSDIVYEAKKIMLNFENLFNGNKQLSDHMNMFINENWEVLDADIQPTIREIIKEIAGNIMANVIKNTPYTEIFKP